MKKYFSIFLLFLVSIILVACKDNKPVELNYEEDIYYSLFVRSFADSDGDGIGDLNGITENLDYLEELGITALWLLPIFESPTYHGYDTIDYYKINPDYGTMDDLENLINEANEKGIKIILDLVINHTSDQHQWFIEASKGTNNPYRDYYVWNGNSAHQEFVGGMMDLNLRNEEVKNEIYKIVDFYLDLGIQGFRLDAVPHFFAEFGAHTAQVENILFMDELVRRVKSKNEQGFVVGEVLINDYNLVKNYFMSGASYFNFYVQNEIINKVGSGTSSYLLARNLERMYDELRKIDKDFIDSPIIGNHDFDRIASSTGFNNIEKLKLASRILLTLPGSPFIYYGDELGLKGKRYEGDVINSKVVYDEYRRQPFLWGNSNTTTWLASDGSNDDTKSYLEQKDDDTSLLNTYKEMANLRKNTPALMYGNSFYAYSSGNIQGYLRVIDDENFQEAVFVVHSFGVNPIELDFDYEIIYGNNVINQYGTTIYKVPFNEIEELM